MNELLYAGLCFITAGAEPSHVPLDNTQENKSQTVYENQSQPNCATTSVPEKRTNTDIAQKP